MGNHDRGGSAGKQTRRQFVKFTFFSIDPAWRRIEPEERERGKQEFCDTVAGFGDRMLVRGYSLMGTRGDADFMLWQICHRLEDIQELATALAGTALGPYLRTSYSYLAMTRRSMYVAPEETSAKRLIIQPSEARYLFVYPFVKTRAWYKLSKADRQRMMDEHIAVGRKYPSVKLNTTYSFGLDDQEFVLSFETDQPSDFLDLVMELRETEASIYTLRDTPIFSCVAMSVREALDSLGAVGDEAAPPKSGSQEAEDGWVRVADLAELPAGSSKAVFFRGEQVAVFNVEGKLYALSNRCSHANGPLAEGDVEGTSVTCPWHGSRFDLRTGRPCQPPAVRQVPTYQVREEGGGIFLASRLAAESPATLAE